MHLVPEGDAVEEAHSSGWAQQVEQSLARPQPAQPLVILGAGQCWLPQADRGAKWSSAVHAEGLSSLVLLSFP